MKACVLSDWKKLEIKELPDPQLGQDEALIEVVYGGVCGSDVTVTNHNHPTATIPRILCHEVVGQVKAINTTKNINYKVGDKVVVFPLTYCGECIPCLTGHTSACSHLKVVGVHQDGGFAERCKFAVGNLIPVGEELPYDVAALAEPLSVAYHANSQAETKPGDKVLVIGGGVIGLLCAQTARYFGADVYLSEIKSDRLALAASLGIRTINPMETDIDIKTKEITNGAGFDVVLEVTGSQAGYDTMIRVCRECGTIVTVAIPAEKRSIQTNMFILKEINMRGIRCCPKTEFEKTVKMLNDMYEAQETYHLEKLIAKVLPLERVAEGVALQETGQINGKILIQVRK